MRPKQIVVIDLIRETVEAANTAVIAELQAYDEYIHKVNFVPGTPGEIEEVLTLMSQQGDPVEYERYPLFALLMSFPENHGLILGQDNTVELNILIARRSNNTDKTPDRYENNFKPVLYPVYLEWLNQLFLSPKFAVETPDNIPHTKIDWPYYNGEKDTNAFGDFVDAIQVKIKLKILINKC
jgi:hypothetical protein